MTLPSGACDVRTERVAVLSVAARCKSPRRLGTSKVGTEPRGTAKDALVAPLRWWDISSSSSDTVNELSVRGEGPGGGASGECRHQHTANAARTYQLAGPGSRGWGISATAARSAGCGHRETCCLGTASCCRQRSYQPEHVANCRMPRKRRRVGCPQLWTLVGVSRLRCGRCDAGPHLAGAQRALRCPVRAAWPLATRLAPGAGWMGALGQSAVAPTEACVRVSG